MTTVTLFKKGGLILGFEAKDHAGFASKGDDIVCASISVLIINTINAIDELNNEEVSVYTDEDDGIIRFELISDKEASTQTLLKAMELGLRSIRDEYGSDYLNVKTKEVNDNVKA